jgi:hypothetical protein
MIRTGARTIAVWIGLEKRARDVVTTKAVREVKRVVGIWSARHAANRDLWFYPTIGAAVPAESPWLRFYWPACRQIGEVDLRKLDRHRGAMSPSVGARSFQHRQELLQRFSLAAGFAGRDVERKGRRGKGADRTDDLSSTLTDRRAHAFGSLLQPRGQNRSCVAPRSPPRGT